MALLVRDDGSDAPARNGAHRPKADPIREALTILVGDPEAVRLGMVEVRALGVSRHSTEARHAEATLYCCDEQGLSAAARDAADLTRRAEAVYWTLNPIHSNRRGMAADHDVARRRWLLVDLDPKRPGHKTESSTDAEKAVALARARKVRDHLRSEGWPDPILADSGNGYHLLYRIDLPADDRFETRPDGTIAKTDGPSSILVRRCLRALAARHDDDQVEVDVRNYNASRICKLYGTWARKGEDTPDRPHRLASLLEIPKPLQVVGIEWLRHLASEAPEPESPKPLFEKPAPATNGHATNGHAPKRKGLIVRDTGGPDIVARAEAYVATLPPAISGQGGHATTYNVARALFHDFAPDLAEADAWRILRDYNARCEPPWSDRELGHKVRDAQGKAHARPQGALARAEKDRPPAIADPETGLVEPLDDPHRLARGFLRDRFSHPERPKLAWWNDEFWRWDGCWRSVGDKEINREITGHIRAEFAAHSAASSQPLKGVSTRTLGNVSNALGSLVLVPLHRVPQQPAWLDGGGPDPLQCLPTATQVVHLPILLEHGPDAPDAVRPATPRFFSSNVLAYSFDRAAPRPDRWLGFLDSIWPDDPESIRALQQWFGYLLTSETHQQKMLLVIGPKRSGKGTITRTLKQLVGEANVAAPTLGALATQFGLQQLIGKTVAIVPESRLTGRADSQAIVERLLSISGEDPQSIDRKHLTCWHGTLRTRFVLLGNELPRLGDYSGALPGRFVVLKLTRSFFGSEDLTLGDDVLRELPGILLWAIAGWHDLRQSGRFLQPRSGQEELEEFERLTNPVGAFLAEKCELGEGFEVSCGDLYQAWTAWCKEAGRDHAGDIQGFSRALRAAVSTINIARRQEYGERQRYFVGVRIHFDA